MGAKAKNGNPGSGAPKGNLNSLKHGGRSQCMRLVIGNTHKKLNRQKANALAYRRGLERLVEDAKGEINTLDAHLINECCVSEFHASLCRYALANKLETMSVAELLKCGEGVMRAATTRNKAIERLDLDAPPQDPWQALDAEVVAPTTEEVKP